MMSTFWDIFSEVKLDSREEREFSALFVAADMCAGCCVFVSALSGQSKSRLSNWAEFSMHVVSTIQL